MYKTVKTNKQTNRKLTSTSFSDGFASGVVCGGGFLAFSISSTVPYSIINFLPLPMGHCTPCKAFLVASASLKTKFYFKKAPIMN